MIFSNLSSKVKFSFEFSFYQLEFYLATVCGHSDLEIVANLTHTLILLLFDRNLHQPSITDQEFQQQLFSIDFLLAKK